jgi:capsid protein
MLTLNSLIYGGGYSEGAKTLTQGKPRLDGSVDFASVGFASRIREQINWLNVNETDIPAIVTSLTAKTIGVNVAIQVESKNSTFNAQAEAFLDKFCGFSLKNGTEMSNCDITGKHHFSAIARLISDFSALHGGVIVRHHYNFAWTIPYKIELIGVDMIDISKSERYSEDDTIKYKILNGIERDKFGQITHIWMYTNQTKRKSVRVSYSDITYFSEVWISIDQQVAVSKLTSILSRLDDASQYATAELQSAIEEAKAGHYLESSAYSELMKIVAEEVNRATVGKAGKERLGYAKDLITPILKDLSNLGIKAKGLTPIPAGDTVHFNQGKRNGIYKDMNANAEMKISAAQGMSDIGVYSKAAEANFSSIKYTLETDQRTADIRFNDESSKIYFGIFARAIRVGIQLGEIQGRVDYWKNESDYLKFRYLRQNKIDTEPSKSALANRTNLELGVDTVGQIVERAQGVKYETFLASKFDEEMMRIEYDIRVQKAKDAAYERAGLVIPTERNENNEEPSSTSSNK